LSFNPPQGKTGTWIIELSWNNRIDWPWENVEKRLYFTVIDQ